MWCLAQILLLWPRMCWVLSFLPQRTFFMFYCQVIEKESLVKTCKIRRKIREPATRVCVNYFVILQRNNLQQPCFTVCQGGHGPLVCLSLGRIMQKLLKGLPWNLVEGWAKKRNPLNFGTDPDQGTDPGIFYFVHIVRSGLFDLFTNFPENNSWILMDKKKLTYLGYWCYRMKL